MQPSRRQRIALGLLATLFLGACAPKVPVQPHTDAPPERPTRRPPVKAPHQEPVLRILLVRSISAVELRSSKGFRILDPSGRQLAAYSAEPKIHLFQSPDDAQRLSVYSEVRRQGRDLRSSRKRLPFRHSVLIVPESGGTLWINGRHYRGRLHLVREGRHFRCVNRVPIETYLQGVIPHEIGHLREEGLEALKAQAVAARTYALQRLSESRDQKWDLVDTVADQVYRGAESEWGPANRAIRETRGQVLWSGKRPAEVYYASTCGGYTADIHQVWKHAPTPYLIAVRDADAQGRSWCVSSRYFRWTHSWSGKELGRILRAYLPQAAELPAGTDIGRLIDLEVRAYTPTGRVKILEVTTDKGRFRVFGDRTRTALKRDLNGNPLRSAMFRLSKERDAQGRLLRVTAVGAGWGHGIGMCQVGAIARSRAGHNYDRILGAYYRGAKLKRLWR